MLGCELIPLHVYRLPMGNGRASRFWLGKDLEQRVGGPTGKKGGLDGKKPEEGGHGNRLSAALGVELAHDGIYVELDGILAHV